MCTWRCFTLYIFAGYSSGILTFNWGLCMLCKTRHNKKPESDHIHIHQSYTMNFSLPNSQPQQILLRMIFLWIESKSKLKTSITIQISYWSFDFDFDFPFLNYFDFHFDSNIGIFDLFRFRFSISIASPDQITHFNVYIFFCWKQAFTKYAIDSRISSKLSSVSSEYYHDTDSTIRHRSNSLRSTVI